MKKGSNREGKYDDSYFFIVKEFTDKVAKESTQSVRSLILFPDAFFNA